MEEQESHLTYVTVKTLDSQSRSYTVSAQMTVNEFKEHISSSVGIPADRQRLIYQGRVLQDEITLAEYNVNGKVIHLVERTQPQTTQPGDSGGVPGSSGASQTENTPTHQAMPHRATHDRNANSYIMLGSVNLPVNAMDPQQIQMSIQQLMAGLGQGIRNSRMNNHIVNRNVDHTMQSEPRLRLMMAENLLQDAINLVQRLEGEPMDGSSAQDSVPAPSSTTSTPSPPSQDMDTSSAPSGSPPASSDSSQTESTSSPPAGPNHPSPAELVEMLGVLRRVEERLQPFVQRAHAILEAATTADYNNNTQEREEDQLVLNLVGEALRLLGNALVALSDLRCNLLSSPPRHLHVIRPMSHYISNIGMNHSPLQVNTGIRVIIPPNGRPILERMPQPVVQSEQPGQRQTPNPQSDNGSNAQGSGQQNASGPEQPGPTLIPAHGFPIELLQAVVNNIAQYAVAMANIASAHHGQHTPTPAGTAPAGTAPAGTAPNPVGTNPSPASTGPAPASTIPTPPPVPEPHQTRFVFTLPSFPHLTPNPSFTTRGTTFNVQTSIPSSVGQLPTILHTASINQMIRQLVEQVLIEVPTSEHASFSSFFTSSSSSSSSSSMSEPATGASEPTHSTSTASQSGAFPAPAQGPPVVGNMDQLLGSVLGAMAAAGQATGANPSVTMTMPGIPAFIQGVNALVQASQQSHVQDPPHQPSGPTTTPPTTEPQTEPTGAAADEDVENAELFAGIVQGVLSTMLGSLGAPHSNSESIAQFIQRLSQTSNIFTPSTGDAMGFFGDLLTLVCQNFSMVDMVMLLHGQSLPLTRIQPQLSQFFSEHYLQGREATEANMAAAAHHLIGELDNYITESFSSVIVRDGVDITQTNRSFLRQQLIDIATHILQCTDQTFGPRLLQLCNRTLFECLALNLYCLRGEQGALTAVINNRIRTMSVEVNPSIVTWLTSIITMRLQVILEHIPVREDQILRYVVHTRSEEAREARESEIHPMEMEDTHSPTPTTTAEEAMMSSQEERAVDCSAGEPEDAAGGEEPGEEAETWAAALPPEWVPIIRQDMNIQRKMKSQPPLSDAYSQGMPAKRRKTAQSDGPRLTLTEAVSQAARTVGVSPLTSPGALQEDLERPELQDAYTQQMKNDIQQRVSEDPNFSPKRFPNTHTVFPTDF